MYAKCSSMRWPSTAFFEEGFWILVALPYIVSTAGLGHGDENLPLILVNEHFPVQFLEVEGKENKNFLQYVSSCCRNSQVIQ